MRMIKKNVERIVSNAGQAARLKKDGFKELMSEPDVLENENEKKLEKMTASELKNLAKEKGIESCSGLTKAELLTILKDVV